MTILSLIYYNYKFSAKGPALECTNIMRPPWNKYKCEALYKHLNNEYLTLHGS